MLNIFGDQKEKQNCQTYPIPSLLLKKYGPRNTNIHCNVLNSLDGNESIPHLKQSFNQVAAMFVFIAPKSNTINNNYH